MLVPTGAHLQAAHIEIQRAYPAVPGGLADTGRLDSIAERPFRATYGQRKYVTIYEQAACLMEGMIRFHPFPDGNKRTALLAAALFLQSNGIRLAIGMDAVDFVVDMARSGASTEEEVSNLMRRISSWLEEHSTGKH